MTRVRSSLVLAMVLLLGAALASAAESQAPGSGRRGFGMMGGRGGSLLGLLRLEQVQKELKLKDEQVAKVKEIGQKLREEMGPQWAKLRDIEDRQQRRAKMTELSSQFDQKARAQLREVLPGEQMIRLYQIRLQVRGAVYGLNHKFIAGRLKLTDEQKKKVAEIDKSTQQKRSEAYSGLRNLSQEQRREKMAEVRQKLRKIRSDANAQALGLLTAEQKEAFEKLKGKKFELQMQRGRP